MKEIKVPTPVAVDPTPLTLTQYEAGFVDGYMVARGIFDSSQVEFQRAVNALKKSRERGVKTEK